MPNKTTYRGLMHRLYNDDVHNKIPMSVQHRSHRLDKLNKEDVDEYAYINWRLPISLASCNTLNSSISFLSKHCVKIRYNPLKLLNFNQVLSREFPTVLGESVSNYDNQDFEIVESETFLNIPDNNSNIPYNGAISDESLYSTTKTAPTLKDREFFKELLIKSYIPSKFNGNTLISFHNCQDSNLSSRKKYSYRNHEIQSRTKIEYIYFRHFEIKIWYTAPYPEEYNKNKILYICDRCLKYMNSKYIYYRHQLKCQLNHPPGNEIYRYNNLSVWEVDGRQDVIYCQNLCLLAKLFLNSKTLYYDVEPFVFYILTEFENDQFNIVGYFSKEKCNSADYNLSCILVLPIYQRRGFGYFLIDFSYLLSRREFKWGTPEKPLSDLGLISYRNFWKIKLIQTLCLLKKKNITEINESLTISLVNLSNLTGMTPTDVIFGLEQLELLYYYTDEITGKRNFVINVKNWSQLVDYDEKWNAKNYPKIEPEYLVWKPLIFGPSYGINAINKVMDTNNDSQNYLGLGDPQKNCDWFKSSISSLISFMSNDIWGSKLLEEIAITSIEKDEGLIQEWKEFPKLTLAYEHPILNKSKPFRLGMFHMLKDTNNTLLTLNQEKTSDHDLFGEYHLSLHKDEPDEGHSDQDEDKVTQKRSLRTYRRVPGQRPKCELSSDKEQDIYYRRSRRQPVPKLPYSSSDECV